MVAKEREEKEVKFKVCQLVMTLPSIVFAATI